MQFILKILLVAFIAGINFSYFAFAQADNEETIARPKIEYKPEKLRDPFASYLLKEAPPQEIKGVDQELMPQEEVKIDTSSIMVQGTIWGNIPMAIINDNVLSVGDQINGGKIIKIDKKGVTIDFSGQIVDLSVVDVEPENDKKQGG